MKGSKLKQTVIKQSYLLPLLLMVVLLAGCKTSKVVKTTPVEPAYLSSDSAQQKRQYDRKRQHEDEKR